MTPGVCSVCGRAALCAIGTLCYRHREPSPNGDLPRPASRKHGCCKSGGCRNVPVPGKATCLDHLEAHSAYGKRHRAGARAARDYLAEQWAKNRKPGPDK